MYRFLLLCVLFLARAASARCLGDGVQVFPRPGATVPTNTRLLLEGIGTARGAVADLPGKVMRLQTNGHEVRAKAQRGWTSELGRVTVVLKLDEPLLPDKLYTLRLDDALPGVVLLNGVGAALPEWRSGKGADKTAPSWSKRPSVSEGLFRKTPEGITRYVRLTLAAREESPMYMVVTLARKRSGAPAQHYVLPVVNGSALLGHEPCSGAFAFEDGKSYRARVEVFDAAGNLAPAVPPLDFEAPAAPYAGE
ncbi:hypothetical protein [Hyalangium rubrum]|uniref:SbsA Ig-like domain-containing protein n=1 Tax=Hyalangium rubrum TaxID=3103134 RepID=A0ABU5H6R5_9BACT|nr:hypothetical protein [Hyalangium sp. s54d21]MDY7227785.1 hypothetical protein [Hyalangium sp. s54d21]